MGEVKTREQYIAEGGTHLPQYDPLMMWVYEGAINAFRALLDEVGLNRTMEATKRYNDALGRALTGMVKERFGQQESDLESIAMCGYYVHSCTSFGHIKPLEIHEGGAIIELFACPNPGMNAPPEMCVAMSHIMADAYCSIINPDYEVIFTNHMGNGDDSCRYVIRRKDSKFPLNDLGRLTKVRSLDLSMDEMGAFAARMVIFSQLVTFTAVLNDLVGPERTVQLIRPLGLESGKRFGKIMNRGIESTGDLKLMNERMGYFGALINQQGPPATITESMVEKEIVDCPFKGAPPEVCKQFEAMFNGICQVTNSDFEFVYDRMMSSGNNNCHWVIKRRGASYDEEGRSDGKVIDETAIELLKKRMAKGEITLEQYRQLRDALLEK